MSITDEILATDSDIKRHNEGHWNEEYVENGGFSSFNDAGIECETGEFLYSLVRLLKPENILETGTHWGVGATYMGKALQANQKGELTTIEFLPPIHLKAISRLRDQGLFSIPNARNIVRPLLMDVADFVPDRQYELILLDTEPQTRFAELIKFFDALKPGGFVFIHDLHRHMHQIPNQEHGFAWPYGVIPEEMKDLIKNDRLRPFHFTTPRGLTGFYKPSPEDYDWR